MRRKDHRRLLLVLVWILSAGWAGVFGQAVPYTVPPKPWNDSLGNHRAVIRVRAAGEAVWVDIPWRRRDAGPEKKAVLVTDEAGTEIRDVDPVLIDREHGQILFRPVSGAGTYYVYYLPYRGKKDTGYYHGDYLERGPIPDPGWLARATAAAQPAAGSRTSAAPQSTAGQAPGSRVPVATVVSIQSRTAFDSFFPMEVIATHREVSALIQRHPGGFLLFPEDRTRPIRMKDDLPAKWMGTGPSDTFSGTACRNEYYVFQLGLFAAGSDVRDIHVDYGDASYPVTCFNLEGYDSRGVYFKKTLDVPQGKVQALWFGVDIPGGAAPGVHTFTVRVSGTQNSSGVQNAAGAHPETQTVRVRILVKDRYLADRGDGETWRGSRLRWLNSRLGIDDSVTHPYSPLRVTQNVITGKSAVVRLDDSGFPVSINAGGQELLQAPIAFKLVADKSGADGPDPEMPHPAGLHFLKQAEGLVEWESEASGKDIRILCSGSMESDGYLHYRVRMIAQRPLSLQDIRLEIPVNRDQAGYFMGMGLPGMDCPPSYSWKWHGPQNAFWIGNADAGIYCKFRGATYDGPMLNLYHPAPPPAWYNGDKGGFTLLAGKRDVTCAAYTGEKTFQAGDTCDFDYSLLVTPVKPVNPVSQFTDRYYHNSRNPAPSEEDLRSGVKIINIHHGNQYNPYINYPFLTPDSIRAFVLRYHQKGLKVKLYYTIRELSNQATELWALRSLGTEVLADGSGGGYPWLREHLADHYTPQWFTPISGREACDAAVLTSGDSRWYNYYIEGLRWLVRNTGIDGLYLDDVAFDRSMLKRMRKVMDREKPGCLIDLHSNTGFSKGPATQYTEYFPYINKLWFGEHFWYDQMPPANWLVEVSGIPFGLMGDMLQGGGNPWRGMVYGMTVRYPWYTAGVNCDPRAIWQVWDEFGIADAKMVGYWNKDKIVTTSDPDVLATAYVKDGRLLIALASWAKDTVRVRLNIDWDRVGWKPAQSMIAPAIEHFQPGKTFGLNEWITVKPAKGWLLSVSAQK